MAWIKACGGNGGSGGATITLITREDYEALTEAEKNDGTFRIISDMNAPADTNLAKVYKNDETYNVGEYRTYNGVLYKCTTAISTPEDFDSDHWTAVYLSDEVSGGVGGVEITYAEWLALPETERNTGTYYITDGTADSVTKLSASKVAYGDSDVGSELQSLSSNLTNNTYNYLPRHANYSETYTDIIGYNSLTNYFECPSDGLISITITGGSDSYDAITAHLVSVNGAEIPFGQLNRPTGNSAGSVNVCFVCKGMRIYITTQGTTSTKYARFYPATN